MYWDGTRWITDPASDSTNDQRPTSQGGRSRHLITAFSSVTLVGILVVSSIVANGATSLSARSRLTAFGTAIPGSTVTIVGAGLPATWNLQLTWDGGTAAMPAIVVGPNGSFSSTIRIPTSARLGRHVVGVLPASSTSPSRGPRRSPPQTTIDTARVPLASMVVNVVTTAPTPTTAFSTPLALLPGANGASTPSPDPTFGSGLSAVPSAQSPSTTPAPILVGQPAPPRQPNPTPNPTPRPTPKPTPKPAPRPGTPVPTSIDATGSSDVSSKLIDFIGTVPNGSTIVFKAGGTYRIDKAIKVSGRSGLTFDGNGATITGRGGTTEPSSLFWLAGGSGITIEDFSLVGNSSSPGVYVGGREGAMAILVDGADDVDISGCTSRGTWGDFVEVNSGSSGVHVYDNTVVNTGRNALSVIWGNHVEFDHNTIDRAGYVVFDLEPNNASEPISYINIHDNHTGYWSDAFFAVDGSHTGASIHDVTVARNVSTGYTLLTVVDSGGHGRDQRITFTGNSSNVSGSGPILTFAHVDGLTITANHQSLSRGSLASIVDSTAVTKDF